MSSSQVLAIVCMKWGEAFAPDYVNVLHSAVLRNISEPCRFICFTDDPRGIHKEIEVRDLPDMGLPEVRTRDGCWPKLGLFKAGLVEDASLMLFLDLDVIIQSSLDPLVQRARSMTGLHMIREWNYGLWTLLPPQLRPNRGGQSSILIWRPEEQNHIYDGFMADPVKAFQKAKNDQEYITISATRVRYLPYGWTCSFKRSCLWYYPFNLIFKTSRPPRRAKVIVFHGKPRPHELVGEDHARWGTKRKFGHGPVEWVRQYWAAAVHGEQ